MAKFKNQKIWSRDHEMLKRLADEQENYIGRQYNLDLSQNLLTVFALPQRRRPKEKRSKERT